MRPLIFTKIGIEKYMEKSALIQNLNDLSYIQLATFHNFEHLNQKFAYFDVTECSKKSDSGIFSPDQLFSWARLDVLNSLNLIIKEHRKYISSQDEHAFLRNMLETDVEKYCLYMLMKVHHLYLLKRKILIRRIRGEFHQSHFFMWMLCDIRIVDAEFMEEGNQKAMRELNELDIGGQQSEIISPKLE